MLEPKTKIFISNIPRSVAINPVLLESLKHRAGLLNHFFPATILCKDSHTVPPCVRRKTIAGHDRKHDWHRFAERQGLLSAGSAHRPGFQHRCCGRRLPRSPRFREKIRCCWPRRHSRRARLPPALNRRVRNARQPHIWPFCPATRIAPSHSAVAEIEHRERIYSVPQSQLPTQAACLSPQYKPARAFFLSAIVPCFCRYPTLVRPW